MYLFFAENWPHTMAIGGIVWATVCMFLLVSTSEDM